MAYSKNDVFEIEITDIGNDGEGIGRYEGYTLFVKDAVIGDVVKAKIMKAKKTYAYAHLEEIVKPSDKRVEPECSISKACGGCQIQALSYTEQLKYKQNKVRNNLIRIGGFDEALIDSIMEPIVGMEEPYHYRGKSQFPVGCDNAGKIITGFYAGRTHSIIPNTDCIIGVAENKEILEVITGFMEEYHVPAYDEKSGKGLVRHILIRKGFATSELMVCIVINGSSIPSQDELIRRLSQIKNMTSVSLSSNTQNTNVIMGKKITTIWGKDTIEDIIHECNVNDGFARVGEGISFAISPLSFYQVNPVQTERLYSIALDYAALTGEENVWDLYCGIGTISLFLASKAKKVYGVEIIPQAIEDAKRNAKINEITNATFMVGKAEEVLPEFYQSNDESEMNHPDVIVVDPPRKGCDEACLNTMLKMKPERIVYVSCDPATLARDLKYLNDGGYELKRIRPVDMFSHSIHVETVCLLSRKP